MANALSGFRQKVSRVAELANAVKRLHDTGIIDLANLSVTLQTVKNSRVYGPQATMAIQGGRKYPSLPAVVDERGSLTYKQVDDMSTALARGLKRLGIDEGSVVGESGCVPSLFLSPAHRRTLRRSSFTSRTTWRATRSLEMWCSSTSCHAMPRANCCGGS